MYVNYVLIEFKLTYIRLYTFENLNLCVFKNIINFYSCKIFPYCFVMYIFKNIKGMNSTKKSDEIAKQYVKR